MVTIRQATENVIAFALESPGAGAPKAFDSKK